MYNSVGGTEQKECSELREEKWSSPQAPSVRVSQPDGEAGPPAGWGPVMGRMRCWAWKDLWQQHGGWAGDSAT